MSDQLDQNTEPETGAEVSTFEDETVEESPQYGVGPFSIREIALAGVWLVAFVVSFFPVGLVLTSPQVSLLFGFGTVWSTGLGWILTIGLPTVAVFLLILRRLSPDGIRRVGSLGIDQFASVAFSVSAIVWLQLVWETVAVSLAGGEWLRSWVIWVQVILMLVGVILTVFAPLIPPFDQDFRGRREVPAHRNARPVRAVSARPKPVRPEAEPAQASADVSASPEQQSYDTSAYGESAPIADDSAADWSLEPESSTTETTVFEQVDVVEPAPSRQQAFWALVPEERDVVDESGAAIFRIGPTAWALVIEDHGDRFTVRHEDGRVGHLHDVSGVTRG